VGERLCYKVGCVDVESKLGFGGVSFGVCEDWGFDALHFG
jgi:hypothetical protein